MKRRLGDFPVMQRRRLYLRLWLTAILGALCWLLVLFGKRGWLA